LPYKYHPTPVSKGRGNKRKMQRKNENRGGKRRRRRRGERTEKKVTEREE